MVNRMSTYRAMYGVLFLICKRYYYLKTHQKPVFYEKKTTNLLTFNMHNISIVFQIAYY